MLQWARGEKFIRDASPNFGEMLKSDPSAENGKRAPLPGELMYNPTLAHTFRRLAKGGKAGFYQGEVAQELIKVVQDLGGHLTLEDLKYHMDQPSQEVDPISLKFSGQNVGAVRSGGIHGNVAHGREEQGVEVWEHPPNGQGVVALMALGILQILEKDGKVKKFTEEEHNSAEYLHVLIECLRIAFADANWWVTDQDQMKVPAKALISPEYLKERAKLFDPKKASDIIDHGSPAHNHCDTVYFAVTDKHGNGISFINSNYGGFGTCIIPKGCGFTLQNRGANFSLLEGHPNIIAPNKRPYHTIIPALITNPSDNTLHSVYGVMGGFMQPQGHVQVLLNMLAFKFTPQAALDAPRFCIGAGTPDVGKVTDPTVYLEDGISKEAVEGLKARGHKVEVLTGTARGLFGRGQLIRCHQEDGKYIYSAGSDPRADGAAIPA
jgi:gamma-glutamyltranspeptidase/glutathione hydrolase